MAVDTFMAYVGVYDNVSDAHADYELVKDLHTEANLIDAYDAALVERRADGKVKITKKHETPTRAGGVHGGGVGLATGLVVALSRSPPSAAGCSPRSKPTRRPPRRSHQQNRKESTWSELAGGSYSPPSAETAP